MPPTAASRKPAGRFCLLLAACIVLFLHRGLFSAGYYDPANLLLGHFPWRSERAIPAKAETNYLLTDLPTLIRPGQWLAAREVRAGRAPLWNPYAGAGRPLLANNQSAVWSPASVGHYLFGERVGLLWGAAWRLLSAGVGMWVLARRLGLQEAGAAAAGLLFAFCGPMVVWLGYPLSAVLAMLPWLLAAAHALVHRPGPLPAAGLALALGVTFACGHAETTFKVVLTAGLWGAWLFAWQAPRRWATVRWTAAALVLGGLLASAPTLPFIEYMLQSESYALRSGPVVQKLPPVPPAGALAWLLPDFFGHPQGETFWLPDGSYTSMSAYVGLSTPLLAVWALRRGGVGTPLIGLALLGALAALGVYGLPPVIWAFDSWPLFRMSLNNRYLIVTVAAALILAGRAVDGLAERPISRRVCIAVAALGALLAVVPAMWPLAQSPSVPSALLRAGIVLCASGTVLAAGGRGRALLVVVAVADVLSWGYRFNAVSPPGQHYPVTPLIARLQAELAAQPQQRLLARGYIFAAEAPLRYGLRDVKGHDAMEVARYVRYLDIAAERSGGSGGTPPVLRVALYQAYRSPLLDAVGTAVVLSAVPLHERQFTPMAHAPGVYVYRNTRRLPRARLARAVEVVPNADAAAERLRVRGHDPARLTLLEGAPAGIEAGGQGPVTFLADEPTRVRLRTHADGPAVLMLADVMFPGWQATLDGSPVPIWYADLAFRAVAVPAGAHVVEFVYRPRSVAVGLGLSAVGLVAIGGLAGLGLRRRRRAAPAAPHNYTERGDTRNHR